MPPLSAKQPSMPIVDSAEQQGREQRTLPSGAKNVSEVANSVLNSCQDAQKMGILVECCGVASQICDQVGGNASEAVPFLGMATSPLYFFHALKFSIQRFRLMVTAAKTNQKGLAVYYAARAIDSTGSAIGNISKSISGGFKIIGVGTIPGIGVLFTTILPIILIVAGSIGAIAQGSALLHNSRAIKKFNQEVNRSDISILQHLETLRGPRRDYQKEATGEDPLVHAKYKLAAKNHEESHFSHEKRKKALQKRIDAFLQRYQQETIQSQYNQLFAFVDEMIQTLTGKDANEKLQQNLNRWLTNLQDQFELLRSQSATLNEMKRFRVLIKTYEELLTLIKTSDLNKDSQIFETLEKIQIDSQETLNNLKIFLRDSNQLLGLGQSEMHRVILSNIIYILLASMVLTSGILYLSSSNLKTEAFAISMSSSGVTLLYFLFDRSVNQEKFHKWDPWVTFHYPIPIH